MNIFAFRPFKGKFNLGDSADIPENEDGTLIGAVKEVKASLTDFSFRDNNGVAEYSMDGGTTWNKIGGGKQNGYFFQIKNQSVTIDISDLEDSDYITLNCFCSNNTINERVTVSTIKGWTSSSKHAMTAYVYGVINVYYSSGKFVIEAKSDNAATSEFSFIINT